MLSPRRARFVEEYLVDLNGTQAAIRAGYSANTATSQAERLLRNVDVKSALRAAKSARIKRTGVSQDKVLEEVALLQHSCVTDYAIGKDGRLCPAPGRPASVMRAVASVKYKQTPFGPEVEFRLWDKPSTLRLGMQHLGMIGDKPKGGDEPDKPVTAVKVTVVDASVPRADA